MKSRDDAASSGRLPFKVAAQLLHNKHMQPHFAFMTEFHYSLCPHVAANSSHAPDTRAPDTQQKQKSIDLIPRQTLINPKGRCGQSEEGKLWIWSCNRSVRREAGLKCRRDWRRKRLIHIPVWNKCHTQSYAGAATNQYLLVSIRHSSVFLNQLCCRRIYDLELKFFCASTHEISWSGKHLDNSAPKWDTLAAKWGILAVKGSVSATWRQICCTARASRKESLNGRRRGHFTLCPPH